MKRAITLILAALLLCAAFALAQSGVAYLVPLWTGQGYSFVRLGPSLAVVAGELNATTKARRYGVILPYDATAKGWRVPASASNVCVWVNEMRRVPAGGGVVAGGTILNEGPDLQPSYFVFIDYDE